MTKLARTLSAVLIAAVLCWPLAAVAKEQSRVYVIKKGDTLWGLSERFIKDPYYWPNLWANNPYITNPHLIYPGQRVRVRDGRLEILPAAPAAAEQAAGTVGAQVPPLPEPTKAITVKTIPGGEGFVVTSGFAYAGALVDFIDGRIAIATDDVAFAQFADIADVKPGTDYAIYRQGREIDHPVTGKLFGHLIEEVGTVEVQKVNGDVATTVVTRALKEIQRGDVLLPQQSYASEIALKKADADVHGVILGARDERIAMAQHDIIYLDQGKANGLQVGNMVYISRPRAATEYALHKKELVLPDRLLGAAVVVKVTPDTASALIVKSVAEIHAGDKIEAVMP